MRNRLTRRECLQVGFSTYLGLGLPQILSAKAESRSVKTKHKSVILIFLTGAPSHIDTFDPKPDAPAEIRGSFSTIATSVNGIRICDPLPLLAARAHKYAIIRSMTHSTPVHEIGTHFLLTGIDALPTGSTHMASRNDWPNYASGLDVVRPRTDGIPNGVLLPTYLNAGYGFSGQYGGLLGAKYDPWHIRKDPNAGDFRLEDDSSMGLSVPQIQDRKALLESIDQQRRGWEQLIEQKQFSNRQERAFEVLSSGRLSNAFSIDREPEKVRNAYGRHLFGQSLLLSRRLIEVGVPFVQAHMGSMNQWDTHTKCCETLKNNLLPPLDRGVSALLDDLDARGLLEETQVVMVGEFGRTPKLGTDNGGNITAKDGRDHWAGAFFTVIAGGGVKGGQVIGSTDKNGAYPAIQPYNPSDLGATIYSALGIDPGTEVHDRQGRPLRLNNGTPIAALYS
jgi:hypothetical protein